MRAGGRRWRVRSGRLDPTLGAVLADPERCLQQAGDAAGRLARTGGLVVKRYRAPRGVRLLKSLVRGFRAARAWRVALELEALGVPTPPAVAVTVDAPWRRSGYLVTEEIAGAATLDAWPGPRRDAARELARLVAALHDHGYSHRDLNAGNLLLDPAGRPWLVDLDTVRRRGRGPLSRARAIADLARLARRLAAVATVSRTDRLRFLQPYAQARGGPDWRWWWRLTAARVAARGARRTGRDRG